jgi:xylulokinase
MSTWLGLDIGTSSLKALLVDDAGKVCARASARYPYGSHVSGPVAEQDPAAWIDAAHAVITQCVSDGGIPDGIGVCGQVPTLVVLNEDGHPVRPAMTWQDSRAVDEAAELEREIGDARAHVGLDLPWSPSHLPAKLLWLSRHEPDTLTRGRLAMQPKDYLGQVLTGSATTDAWSSKGMVDVRTADAAHDVLAATGWPSSVCPPTGLPWEARGVTLEGVLGLPAGIQVSVGWSDALASMLAIGAFSESLAFVLTGTSEIVGLSLDDDDIEVEGLYSVPRSVAPRPVLYGPTQSSGAALLWLAGVIGCGVEELTRIADTARDSTAPMFVPYISGERAPLWDPDVRALFAGISAEHGMPELARSVMRGVALSASHILSLASRGSDKAIREVHIAGRAVDDSTWNRLRLETLGAPVLLHSEPYTSALGAAMLGCAAANGGDLTAAEPLREVPERIVPSIADINSSHTALADYEAASALAQRWTHR